MLRELRTSFGLFFILFAVTGVLYPLLTLQIGQMIFPYQAQGSLVKENDKIIGSTLIGQNFASDVYFHPRPSSAGNGYDASNSSGSNLGPTSADLIKAVGDRVADLKKSGNAAPIPVDLVTGSGSGLDPDISPDAALYQAPRIAAARHVDVTAVTDLINQKVEGRTFDALGDARVNVLELNRALDRLAPLTK